ncbi:hypothetical protein [Cytophaga hutchinsonii]|nr:hypothetical protein [Cytophaga hutchinsonii]
MHNSIAQGDLNTSKQELKKGKEENVPQQDIRKSPNHNSGERLTGTILGSFIVYTIYGMIGNYENEGHLHNRLSKYPYCAPLNGNYAKSRSDIHRNIRFDIEDHFMYSNQNLYGNHLKAKLRPFHYFYFQSEMFQLFEYNTSLKKHDNLLLYNLDFCYDRIRLERFNLGFTIGANYVANNVKKGGLAFGFNTEIFIAKPISLYSSIKWSGINGLPVNTFEVQGKYHQNIFFISIGYQRLKIATPKYHFAAIGLGAYF